jgi:hypothetical protein
MAHEKAIYWMAVGILGLGLYNSLPPKLNSKLNVSLHSGPVVRRIASDLYALTRYNAQSQMSPELACARANAITIQTNLDQVFRARDEQIRARLSAVSTANCSRQRALRIRKNMVIATSGSSVGLISDSMWNGTPSGPSE